MQMAERGFRNALAEGVTIGCGSDVGPYPHGENARELVWMTRLGMSAAQALAAATSVNATILGKESELGSIKPGYLADLIAVVGCHCYARPFSRRAERNRNHSREGNREDARYSKNK